MARPSNDSAAAVRAAENEFKMDLREYGRELGRPGGVSPELLAERFQRMALSVSERWPAGSEHRSRYLAGVRAQTRMDMGLSAKPNPLYERFLSHLLSLLEQKGPASHG